MIEIKYWDCPEILSSAKEIDGKMWIIVMALPWSPKMITLNKDDIQKYINAIRFAEHPIKEVGKEVFDKRVDEVYEMIKKYPG